MFLPLFMVWYVFKCEFCGRVFYSTNRVKLKRECKEHLLEFHKVEVLEKLRKYVDSVKFDCPGHGLRPEDIDDNGKCRICGYNLLSWFYGQHELIFGKDFIKKLFNNDVKKYVEYIKELVKERRFTCPGHGIKSSDIDDEGRCKICKCDVLSWYVGYLVSMSICSYNSFQDVKKILEELK